MVAEDLFESALEERFDEFAPLAARMRPKTLDEFVGQDHIVGKGGPLRSLIEADRLTSVILWGPPGTGKTTLASIVATATKSRFVQLSAVSSGVADVRKVLKESKESLGATGRKTILFIDEIHRFNKSQQDALLQAVENSWVTLIGATTENPFFEVNSPLISRSLLFRLNPLGAEEIGTIVDRAIKEPKRGLGASGISVEPDAVAHIVDRAGGDARFALNALEVSVAVATARGDDTVKTATAEEALQRRVVRYDKGGDQHYDVISAFIKSLRGSDPDAAVWWLAQMLEAGEDPRFIARRMVIFASEDVGNADPMGLVVAVSAFHALEFVGLPEAQLNLSQAVLYLATAPKSNASTTAITKASRTLQERGVGEVPKHLRDAHYPGAKKLGHGEGYRYPHSFDGGWVEQQYLPDNVSEETFYLPTDRGYEKEISELMKSRRPPASGNVKKTRKPRP